MSLRPLILAGLLCCAAAVAHAEEGDRTAAAGEPAREAVLVFAAASATDAVEEIRASFEQARPEVRVRASYGASSNLAQQIAAGAEADLFLSASTQWADFLKQKDLAARQVDLLGNQLVIIVPAGADSGVHRPDDLAGDTVARLALADPQSVPAGVYAKQALTKLGLWDGVRAKVVGAADVRQVLSFVETGAAEAGIVYASDAAGDANVAIVSRLDPALSDPIRYPLVLTKRGAANRAAVEFYDYLQSPDAAAVFRQRGFLVLADQLADGNVAPVAAPDHSLPPSPAPSPAAPSAAAPVPPLADEWQILRLSFQVGLCAVLASLPAGIALGYLLARWSSPARWLVEVAVNLPLVLPPVVTGYLLLVLFLPRGPLGAFLENWLGIRIVFTWLGAALAAAVVSFPLMVRSIRLAFQGVDPRLELAARSLGASRWKAFFTVSLPLARRGVIAGAMLAFARGLGEFGATIMVAGNIVGETQTIPLAIYSFYNRPDGTAQVWRLVTISILLAAGALFASEWLERRQTARELA